MIEEISDTTTISVIASMDDPESGVDEFIGICLTSNNDDRESKLYLFLYENGDHYVRRKSSSRQMGGMFSEGQFIITEGSEPLLNNAFVSVVRSGMDLMNAYLLSAGINVSLTEFDIPITAQ